MDEKQKRSGKSSLLKHYLSLRDEIGSEEYEYARLLSTILFTCPEVDLEELLTEAEAQGKRITVEYPPEVLNGEILTNEISVDWIKLV